MSWNIATIFFFLERSKEPKTHPSDPKDILDSETTRSFWLASFLTLPQHSALLQAELKWQLEQILGLEIIYVNYPPPQKPVLPPSATE